jgi:hypothetical protein
MEALLIDRFHSNLHDFNGLRICLLSRTIHGHYFVDTEPLLEAERFIESVWKIFHSIFLTGEQYPRQGKLSILFLLLEALYFFSQCDTKVC